MSKRFEQWFAKYVDLSADRVRDMWNGSTYTDRTYYVEIAWAAWQEAVNVVAR